MTGRVAILGLDRFLLGPFLQHFLSSCGRDRAVTRCSVLRARLWGGSRGLTGHGPVSQLLRDPDLGSAQRPLLELLPPAQRPLLELPMPAQRPLLELPLSAQRPLLELPLPAQRPLLELLPPAQRPLLELPLSVQRPLLELLPPSQRPLLELPLPAQRPLLELPLSAQRPLLELLPPAQRPLLELLSAQRPLLEPGLRLRLRESEFPPCVPAHSRLAELPMSESSGVGMAPPHPGISQRALEEAPPVPCSLSDVRHGHVQIRPGVVLHFAELGRGPALCLCHGFPESWRSWRGQIPALAQAGFRVIALEMTESHRPRPISEYSQERICEDFVTFLDKLGLARVILIGHDWGGAMAWNVALFYPHRVRAVCSLNTPFRPARPGVDVLQRLESNPAFHYQLYFQQPGVAEAELEKDIGRTLKILIRSWRPEDRLPSSPDFRRVLERGGLLVGFPENPPGSHILPPAELEHYTEQFRKSGFRGPLNWYRNMRENWRWALSARDRKIEVPALMVTAGKDPVLHPKLSHGMERWIPRLRREHLEECGHWTQLERPADVTGILLRWLRELPPEPPEPGKAKL